MDIGLLRRNNKVCHIRSMVGPDFPEVLEIERECFEQPWSEAEWRERTNIQRCFSNVAECGLVVGFILWEQHADCLEIQNLAVLPRFQRQGIGSAMLERLIARRRHRDVVMVVHERNVSTQLFLRENGLRATATFANLCDQDDAYLFSLVDTAVEAE